MSNILKDLKDYIANDDRAKLLRLIEDVERVQLYQDDGDYERLEPLITLLRELYRHADELHPLLTRMSAFVRGECEKVIRREQGLEFLKKRRERWQSNDSLKSN